MKPFDLDEYLKNPLKEIVTRNGQKVRIICTDKIGGYPIIALVLIDGKEMPYPYTELGHLEHGKAHPMDLFFASIKHKGWINVYMDNNGFYPGKSFFETKEEARSMTISSHYVATAQFEWEE